MYRWYLTSLVLWCLKKNKQKVFKKRKLKMKKMTEKDKKKTSLFLHKCDGIHNISQRNEMPKHTRFPWLPKSLLKIGQIIVGSAGKKIPSGPPGLFVSKTGWMLGTDATKEGNWYRFLCICVCSLLLSQLCARSGQCLCARQNFNKGGSRGKKTKRRRQKQWRVGWGRGSMPHNWW